MIETNPKIEKISNIRPKKGFSVNGTLIGNSNTGKLHTHGCKAIGMMREDHKIPTNGAHFIPFYGVMPLHPAYRISSRTRQKNHKSKYAGMRN